MEATNPEDVTGDLIAKSQTRDLDDIRRSGVQQVRVIRASDVASMIAEGVDRVLRSSDAVPDDKIASVLSGSGAQFKRLVQEREQERQKTLSDLQDYESNLTAANQRIARLEQMLMQAVSSPDGKLPEGVDLASLIGGGGGGGPVGAGNADLMMRMMNEMAEMKARLATQGQAAPAAGGGGGGGADGVAEALGKISENLNKRLEQFGKKMGISSAVEGREVNFTSMFDKDNDVDESNMADVEVRKKTGGGIAGNLAKLKKLKGDG